VKEHRRQWQGGPEILVAFADIRQPELKVRALTAYDTEGHRIQLNPEIPPERPVLMIGACPPAWPPLIDVTAPSVPSECDPPPFCPPEPTPEDEPCIRLPVPPTDLPKPQPPNQVILTRVKTPHVEEIWWKGGPEIFAGILASSVGTLDIDLGEVLSPNVEYFMFKRIWVCKEPTLLRPAPDLVIFIFLESDITYPDLLGGSPLFDCRDIPIFPESREFRTAQIFGAGSAQPFVSFWLTRFPQDP